MTAPWAAMPKPREATRIGSSKLVSVRELADILGVPVGTVYHEWRAWDLPAYRVGKHLRFREREIEAWIDRQAA